MRIITGSARGVKLESLEGELTRPTSDRAKEAIFSMLQFDIQDRHILEPFGGSGQLSLEGLSRGASSAYIADSSPEACEIIKRNAKKTKLFEKTRVVCKDHRSLLKSLYGKERFDLIFLDPPYKSTLIEQSLQMLTEGELIADGGIVVCESDKSEPFSADGLTLIKHAKYGKAYVTLLRKEPVYEN